MKLQPNKNGSEYDSVMVELMVWKSPSYVPAYNL